MWPSGSSESQTFQISALDEQLSAATGQIESVINNGLGLVMSDIPTFVNFASNGAFSGLDSLSLPNVTDGLDFALKTYLTSESLLQNGWYANIVGVYNVSQVTEPGCTNITGGILCPQTGDSSQFSKSAGTFWSSASGRQYLLYEHKGNSYSYPILSAINSNGWADMGTLFDGSYTCTAEGKALPLQ